jgi:hypothetical protein
MSFSIGTMVSVRGREWVVLPESQGDLLVLRPLGGTEDEVTGVHTLLENVEPARFPPPDPARPGDQGGRRRFRATPTRPGDGFPARPARAIRPAPPSFRTNVEQRRIRRF